MRCKMWVHGAKQSRHVARSLGTYMYDQVQQVVDKVCGDASTPKAAVLRSPHVNLRLNLGHSRGARQRHSNRHIGDNVGRSDDGGSDRRGAGPIGVARRMQLCVVVVLQTCKAVRRSISIGYFCLK